MTITYGTPAATASGSGFSSLSIPLATSNIGDLNYIVLSCHSTPASTGVQPVIATPSGWTLVGDAWKTGTPSHELAGFYRFYQAGDPTSVTVSWGSGTNQPGGGAGGAMSFSAGMIDTTTPIVTGEVSFANAAGPTTDVTSALTLAAARYVVSTFANRSGATWSAAADGNIHDTIQAQTKITGSASFALCCSGSSTSTGTARSLLSSASTSVNNTGIVAFNPASAGTPATGTASITLTATGTAAPADGGTAAITLTATATARAAATGTATITLTGSATATTPIVTWLNTVSPQWVAHRGGYSATLGEETIEAYTAAAAQYSKALLEISFWESSDGVLVASHDQTTGRVFGGTSLDIPTNTWATLSTKTTIIGGKSIQRVVDIIDAFPGRLFLLDNKRNINHSTYIATFETHCHGRWMGKQIVGGYAWLNACAAAGVPVWDYMYPIDVANYSTNITTNLAPALASGVPVKLGFGDFSTTGSTLPVQSDTTTFAGLATGSGLAWWAHILGTGTQKTAADSQGATAGLAPAGYMTSGFSTVAPADTSAATGAASITLTATATAQAVASGTAALSFTATATAQAAAAGTASITLTATGSALAPGGATGTAAISFTAVAAARAAATGTASIALNATANASSPSTARDITITVSYGPRRWTSTAESRLT